MTSSIALASGIGSAAGTTASPPKSTTADPTQSRRPTGDHLSESGHRSPCGIMEPNSRRLYPVGAADSTVGTADPLTAPGRRTSVHEVVTDRLPPGPRAPGVFAGGPGRPHRGFRNG